MAWDENVCANTPAPEFEIPEDKTARDKLLAILGVEEIEIQTVSESGETVTAKVLGRMED